MGKIKTAAKNFGNIKMGVKNMFMKNEKKKTRPLLAIGVGAMALYGAYSAVACMKKTCCEKAEMLTNVLKKSKKKEKECAEECDCTEEC